MIFDLEDLFAGGLCELDFLDIDGDARELKQPFPSIRLFCQRLSIEFQRLPAIFCGDADFSTFRKHDVIIPDVRQHKIDKRPCLRPAFGAG